jgi:hypothetical protein
MGMVPNMISTMAQSRAVLQAYLGFNQGLARGSLPDALRQDPTRRNVNRRNGT